MLHRDWPTPSERANLSVPEFASAAELLDSFVHFLRQQYIVILAASLVTISLGVTYLILARPSYTAVATMLIDPHKRQSLQEQPTFNDAEGDSATVESQLRVLKSDNVALSVIKNLQLSSDPEFGGTKGGGISEYSAMRLALAAFESRLDVSRDALSYVIEVSFRSHDSEKAAKIANAIVDAYVVDQLDSKYQSTLRASNWLQDRIAELRDQATAGEQAVVDYQRDHNIVDAAGKSTSDQRVAELNSQLIIARTQTAEARARLGRVQTVLSSDPGGAVDATVADTLKSEVITRLRSQYLDLASKEADWAARYGNDHLAVVNLRNQMAEIRSAIVDELRRIAETYKSDLDIAEHGSADAQKEYDDAVAQAQRNNQAQVVLSDLESKSKTYRALYENFLQRYMESVQQQSFPIPEARLISPALRPLQRSSPKIILTLAISACVGIVIGFAIGVFRDLWDRVFRTSEQAEKVLHTPCISLVPLLQEAAPTSTTIEEWSDAGAGSSIRDEVQSPSISEDGIGFSSAGTAALVTGDEKGMQSNGEVVSENTKRPQSNEENGTPRMIVHDENVLWTPVDSPFSRFAESLRVIKVAVDLGEIVRSTKVIGFTSSLPNEGKSTVAAGLALQIAQAGGRVILVDCDLRNPSLTKTLAPSAQMGFIEAISGKAKIEDVLWRSDPRTNLSFLPMVMKSRVAHTNEILASTATKKLFDELRKRYEYIIVDLSPLAPVVDVRTTTHFVDSYVCVIEWGRTKIDIVKKALADAPGVYENLIGTVLNKADISKLGRYDAHRGDYYYNKYYGRYGYVD
jgi:succinoglycan biosynthesis transport protein ExoP